MIDDDEVLYRKVSVKSGWYDPRREELNPLAFNPRKEDTDGISFDRAKSPSHPNFRSIEEVAQGPSDQGYFVAVLEVKLLRANGFAIVADPIDGNPGHALLTDLTYENRRDPTSLEKKVLLAHKLVTRVEGPIDPGSGEQG